MPSNNPEQRLQDILDNIARIRRFSEGTDFDSFRRNEQQLYAIQHALLIISEAASKLGDLAPQLCPEIDWRDVRGLGNRLRHEYSGIDLARLWRVVENDLTPLHEAVERALAKLRS